MHRSIVNTHTKWSPGRYGLGRWSGNGCRSARTAITKTSAQITNAPVGERLGCCAMEKTLYKRYPRRFTS